MKIVENVSLADFTSFRTGGPAKKLITIESNDEIDAALEKADKPLWFLGYGANVLISDEGLDGTVIHLKTSTIDVEDGSLFIADAGVEWDTLVQTSIEHGKWGLERTSGIPGNVGAGIVGNIAAYGQAVSNSLAWVEVIDTASDDLKIQKMETSKLGLDYRYSDFQSDRLKDYLIVRAAFSLHSSPRPLEYASAMKVAEELKLDPNDLKQRREIILESRRRIGSLLEGEAKQTKTAGSFFRNPLVSAEQAEKIMSYEEHGINYEQIKKQNAVHGGSAARVSAAHVLLAAGYKRGQSWGKVRLHPEHILKIENYEGGTSQDIYNVAQEIIRTVKSKLGIDLEPEVRFLGHFN